MPRWRPLLPYALLAILALPALWPLLQPDLPPVVVGGLPRTNDMLIHYYRVVELDALARQGVLLPRWAPHLALGYGYPVFNFFFYLAHYLVEALHLLGLNLLTAFKAALALILVGTAWSAYRLGRDHFREAAGLVTGVAYLYSPYILYDVYIRGSLTEPLALALLPLALWTLRRAAQNQTVSAVVWAGLAIAFCLLAHHGVTLQALPLMIAYALVEAIHASSSTSRRPALAFVSLAFIVAAGLTAFFWLPVLAEAAFIQIERGTAPAPLAYDNNFLDWHDLIAWPRLPVDPALLNPPVVRPLPLLALGAAALAVLFGLTRAHLPEAQRRAVIVFVLAALAGTLLILPLARPVWDVVPLLRLTQFPWRLLGPVSLFIALTAGALFGDGRWAAPLRTWALPPLLAALVFLGLPFATPPFEPVPAEPTLRDLAAFEVPPDFLGTTTTGEYLPRWVQQLPADMGLRREQLMQGQPIAAYEWRSAEAPVSQVDENGLGHTFTFTLARPATFVYKTFYFPGWRASLDGRTVPIQITEPEGLMAVEVPAGLHTLSFTFGDTRPRAAGNILSAISGLIALGWWAASARTRKSAPHPFTRPVPEFARYDLLFGLALLLALARPLLYDAGRTPLLQHALTPEGLRGVAFPLNASFADEVILLGWDASPPAQERTGVRVEGDEAFTLNLYWKARHALGVAYGFDVKLVDERGRVWSEPETPRPRDWRFAPGTDFWPPDQYVLDPYVITPLAGTPPGAYQIQVTVFARHNGQSIGSQRLGPITFTTPSRRACSPEGAASQQRVDLNSIQYSTTAAAPGDEVIVSVCQRVAPHTSADPYAIWLMSANRVVAVRELSRPKLDWPAPRGAGGPAGATLRDQLTFRLPADLTTGDYTWALAAGDQVSRLGTLHVTAPERTFIAPDLEHVVAGDLGPVTLHGWEAAPEAAPGVSLPVTLAWRADELMADSYHVFLHLISAEGALVAQSDGVPVSWTRRTTGWLPGEFVVEARSLALPADLPPGRYTLSTGMYLPADGSRLSTPAFPEGRLVLGEVTIGLP